MRSKMENKKPCHEAWLKYQKLLKKQAAQLSSKYSSCLEQLESIIWYHKKAVEDNSQREAVQAAITELETKEKDLLHKIASLKKQKEQQQQEYKSHEEKLTATSKTVALYRQHLGLRIKKSESDQISFVFTQIDKEHPSDCCFFDLKVENRIYKVVNCIPKIEEIDTMVCELNKTNDLGGFVIAMRKKFCSLL